MNKLYIEGSKKLQGTVVISGSKNAALPILFMTILIPETIKISNIPELTDVSIAIKLLKHLGAKIIQKKKTLWINTKSINIFCPPYYLMKKIRASIWILAPLLVRFRKAKIFFPGGCKIGSRPINLHLKNLSKLGVKIILRNNCIMASVDNFLKGTSIFMEKVSVGATITMISAAVLAKGLTIIENAAQEPEIVDLSEFLNKLGANIKGAGSNKIFIIGVSRLFGGSHKIIPDRIETGTFLIAAAISQGYILCKKTEPKHLKKVLTKLIQSGAQIKTGKNWIQLDMRNKIPKSVNISTSPYPGFPTDMQPQFTLLNSIAQGKSTIQENIFENRFLYVDQLIKMGAKIKIKKKSIICTGVRKLYSNNISSSDLRGSATLVLAGCIAIGKTELSNVYHLNRGYESFSRKLNKLGANIQNT